MTTGYEIAALFELPAGMLVEVEPPERVSAARHRVIRQAQHLDAGYHPLGLALHLPLRLHPNAAPVDDLDAPGRRCGNCTFRQVIGYHNRSYGKCLYGWMSGDAPRLSHGAGTDVRRWWPACTDHEWGDDVSDDAARWVPEERQS